MFIVWNLKVLCESLAKTWFWFNWPWETTESFEKVRGSVVRVLTFNTVLGMDLLCKMEEQRLAKCDETA